MTTPTRVAVVATGHQALHAGLAVAAEGGNAVDVALATSFVALATEPGMVSLGGGCYLSIWRRDDEPVVIDGNVEMPGRGLDPARFGGGMREVVTPYGGGVTMYAGYGSVATPGIVPAFSMAHDGYARLPWARLLAPARTAAHRYPMSPAGARYLAYTADSLFGEDPEAHALVTRADGTLLAGREETTNPLLADVLGELADQGPELFATGWVGRSLAESMARHGGLITVDDLTGYTPRLRPAHELTLGQWRIATNPPPAVGGPMLAIMLEELQRRGDWTWADAIEIQRAVLSYRTGVHDYSTDLESDGLELLAAVGDRGLSALRGSSSTAHISVVDGEDGVRRHHEQRLRGRHVHPGDRHPAQQHPG